MRAVTLNEVPSAPVVAEAETPRPEAGELLVKVAVSSVNGFDLSVLGGHLQGMMEHRFPLVVGMDFAGTVDALGDGVEGYAVGDKVFGVALKPYLGGGALAEYVTVNAGYGVASIPEGLDVKDAGGLGLAGTAALNSIDAARIEKDETVLVSGATGGVGLYLVQLLSSRGAVVLATATRGEHEDVVRRLGATHAVDHTGDLAAQVRAVAPDGVDKVAHLAGDAAALAGLAKPSGLLASLLDVNNESVGRDDLTVTAIQARVPAEKLDRLLALVAAGELEVLVVATYPLPQATEAIDAFRAGPLGKIVVTV
jgi:NADPH:quinone reductase-like Zn-dependent oxidoreductase